MTIQKFIEDAIEGGWREDFKFHEINLTEGWDKAVSYLEELVK